MNRSTLLFAALALVCPVAASAQTARNPYLRLSAGVNHMQEEKAEAYLDAKPNEVIDGNVLTDNGPAFSAALGFNLIKRVRFELEGDYRSNHINGETGFAGQKSGTGEERKFGTMANALFDFGTSRVTPYVGGGAGAQFVHEPSTSSTNCCVTVTVEGGTQSSFAYQAIAGVAMQFAGMRGLSLGLEYRYLTLTGKRKYPGIATVPGVGSFPMTDVSDSDPNHSFMFGIRFPLGHHADSSLRH